MALRDLLAPEARRATVTAALILSAALATTFAVRALSERAITADVQRRFAADSADIATAIGERLRTHAEVLVSMQGLYASIGRVDRVQFRRYIDVLDLARRYFPEIIRKRLAGFKLRAVDKEGAEARPPVAVIVHIGKQRQLSSNDPCLLLVVLTFGLFVSRNPVID